MKRALSVIGALCLLLCMAGLPSPADGRGKGGVRRSSNGASTFTYPWRFAYVSDTHLGWAFGGTSPRNWYYMSHAVDSMSAAGIDFLILGGDYSEDMLLSALRGEEGTDSLEAWLNRSNFQWWPVAGNHEVLATDTTTYEPTYRAIQRWPGFFSTGQPYYSRQWKNLDFMALCNNVNYDVVSATDYIINNPFNLGGDVAGLDYYGLAATDGTQRAALRTFLANRNDKRWLFLAQHRANVGSDSNSVTRASWNDGPLVEGGYVEEIEDSLRTGERGVILFGDQHLKLWFTDAIKDSAKAAATAAGLHHICVSGAGDGRYADTTEVIASSNWIQAYLFSDADGTANLTGKTSTAWADTISSKSDSDYMRMWTWQLYTVHADRITVETFMVWSPNSDESDYFTGAGSSRLIDRRDIRRDLQ